MFVEEILAAAGPNMTVQFDSVDNLKPIDSSKVYNIFFVDSYNSFRKIFKKMTPHSFDNQGWYLIVFTNYKQKQYFEMKQMLDDFWTTYTVNVNIVLKSRETPKEGNMFTYFPFGKNYCEKVYPVLHNTYISGKGFVINIEHFPKKLSNMFNCPVTAVTFENPPFVVFIVNEDGSIIVWGIEGLLMLTLSERMNFSLKYEIQNESSWGFLDESGHSSGAISMVMKKEVNLTFGFFVSTALRNIFMDATFSYYSTNLIWVIGPGEPLDFFERFYKPFHSSVWICLVITFFISIAAIAVIKCQSRNVRNFLFGTGIQNPILNLVNVFFGGVLTKLPGRNFARTLLGLFFVYSFVIRNAYTGALFRFLQSDLRTHEIKNFNEMVASNYSLVVLDFIPNLISRNSSASKNTLEINLKQYESFRSHIHDGGNHIGLLASDDHVAYWNKQEFPDHYYNHCKERILTINLCLFLNKISCLTDEFNRHIMNFNANGLLNLWKKIYRNKSYLKKKAIAGEPEKLSMENLRGGFSFLAFGLIASVLVFAIELFVQQTRNVHRNSQVIQ